ncbi:MAG: hypothetical protein JST68_06565 [Bacteroidetes bacterium]|nr:hypothetical protein [Bacteroidota bacterium]
MTPSRKAIFARIMIVFFTLQIGVDLVHSVTAYPFVHYGMFSESMARPDSLKVFEVTVDGRRLRAEDFRVYRWDMVQTPLSAFEEYRRSGDFAWDRTKVREGFDKAALGGLFARFGSHLTNAADVEIRFPAWYKSYLTRLLGHSIEKLQVDESWYRYRDGRLQLLHTSHYFTL